ncbi:flagellar biosynthesis protein FlhF [Paenibacillus sp. UNCCL117]|uniref:flagellar biosynthesis protein FlhF n=1 Tax=unclassified Paenibacillus TaxID=185978 RepID=UPI000889FC6A|nr:MULTISPECIES: flagellar biosynthesis protein FlhF [unclassified Paenibacillus]SDC86754.1 flagellar biosynthesis protein FlhF [Paenibacillus sp. cl123]SFW27893.1 flagellar biosynthesis protein FlhF [Paenibacillus sp. UNCCL117]
MRVKRYVVDSMPDALQKIRSDLGKDAVIINTKEVRSGGFLGLFSKKKIEVIAAMDNSAPTPTTAPVPSGKSQEPVSASRQQAASPSSFGGVSTAAKPAAAAAYGAQAVQTPPAAQPASSAAAREEKLSLAFPEVPDVFPPAPPAKAPAAPRETPLERSQAAGVTRAKEDLLMDEIKQMKEMMLKLSLRSGPAEEPNPSLERYERLLLDQEIDPQLVRQLLAGVAEEAEREEAELDDAFARQSLQRQLSALLGGGGGKAIAPDTRIAHFVGPTGVGKTTTIAKLAAEQVLKHQRKVGFITSDTYRIAAVEQLKTYGTILNVPLEVVFSPLDLNKAFENLKDCDLIFMDTAGRNFRNEMYVSELNALLRTSGKSETFLVLSLTTKYKDMKAITGNFHKFKLNKVLFTKMDETDSYGAIVNLVHDFGLQPSYIANGQSVPDDISILQEQHIIDLILEDREP